MSACVWNQGAKETIVTIMDKDSRSPTSGDPSSEATPQLSGGAIAGIVTSCVIVGILLAIAITFIILRKRRKWMKAGFAVTATTPKATESVLEGPVFNSAPRSSANNSTPLSAADISTARSTDECSGSTARTLGRPVTIGENVELDGCDIHITPNKEYEDKEAQVLRLNAEPRQLVAGNQGVYELPGSEVACDKGTAAASQQP